MANVYVGPSSAGAADGTSWANRYGTLNAAEDRPLSAGDTVYVGPGTYRELLTVDVSGTAGNPITYIGDYSGANTDGVGGIVRITGAANETTTGTRAQCINASAKSYRTFRGFLLDGASGAVVNRTASGTNWIVEQCVIVLSANNTAINFGGTQGADTVQHCTIIGRGAGVYFNHSSVVDNAASVVQGCVMWGGMAAGVISDRIGGITVKNCTMMGGLRGARVQTALSVGQVMTVNNCLISGMTTAGLQATTTAEFVENYNAMHNNSTDRSNVSTGANSVAYPPGFDMRPYFEAFNAGALVLPLTSLASYSGLVEYSAGTGAPATDWRGHAVAGSLREWGVEEYVSGYGIEAGGGVTMWPLSNGFIQAIIGGGV